MKYHGSEVMLNCAVIAIDALLSDVSMEWNKGVWNDRRACLELLLLLLLI